MGWDSFQKAWDSFPLGWRSFRMGWESFQKVWASFPLGWRPFPLGWRPFQMGWDSFPLGWRSFQMGWDSFQKEWVSFQKEWVSFRRCERSPEVLQDHLRSGTVGGALQSLPHSPRPREAQTTRPSKICTFWGLDSSRRWYIVRNRFPCCARVCLERTPAGGGQSATRQPRPWPTRRSLTICRNGGCRVQGHRHSDPGSPLAGEGAEQAGGVRSEGRASDDRGCFRYSPYLPNFL